MRGVGAISCCFTFSYAGEFLPDLGGEYELSTDVQYWIFANRSLPDHPGAEHKSRFERLFGDWLREFHDRYQRRSPDLDQSRSVDYLPDGFKLGSLRLC